MRTRVSYRNIWDIAYPIILGSVAQNILSVTDTAFLGRVSETALGASAIGGVLYLVFIMIAFGFGTGTQIIIARRDGEKDWHAIGPTVEHAGYFLVLASIIVFLIVQGSSTGLLRSMLESGPVAAETDIYIRTRSWGLLFAFINISYRAFFVGIGKTAVITKVTVVLAIVNVVLDYVLIFGKFGFDAMGIKGAAIASVIAEGSGMVYFTVYTLRGDYRFKYNLYKFSRFSASLFKRIMVTASPVMIQFFLSLAGWFAFFLFVEKMGEHELAVSQVVRSAYIILLVPVWGFAAATNTLVSSLLGQLREAEVLSLVYKVQRLTLMIIAPILLLFMLFPALLISLYGGDASLSTDSVRVLLFVGPASLFMGFNFILFSGVSGTGRTTISLLIELLAVAIYITCVWLFVKVLTLPLEVVWMAEYIYTFILGSMSWIYLSTGRWKGKNV